MKESNYVIILKKLLFFTLIIAAVTYAATFIIPDQYITPVLPFIVVFYFAITLLGQLIIQRYKNLRPRKYINVFMLLTFGRLMLLLMVLLLYILLFREDAKVFAITFLIYYFIFTVFEVIQNTKISK